MCGSIFITPVRNGTKRWEKNKMKKLLVALLCAVMLLTCAGAIAEENGSKTFGEFTCWVDEEDGVFIEKYNLAEGQETLYIPKEIEGHRVQGFSLATLPESVKTVYMPNECGWDSDGLSTDELTLIRYADYEWIQSEEWYSKYLTDMGEDDYALTWAHVYTWKNGDMHEKEAPDFYAEQLPAELDGHKVRFEMLNNGNVIFTSGEWQYKLDTYDDRFKAELVGYTMGEGITEMVIPQQIDGYPVQRFDVAAVPASVKVLYKDRDVWCDGDESGRSITMLGYADFDYIQQNEWYYKQVPEMTENDLALTEATVYTFGSDGYNSKSTYVYADDLPTELLGKKLLCAMSASDVWHTSGKWIYAYSDSERDSVTIKDVTGVEGQTTLFVPSTIEGVQVSQISNTIADKYGITLFVAPRNGWFYGEGKASFGALYYYDRAWVDARQDDYYTEQYAWLGENDLSLEDYTHYANGESTKETIEYKDIPAEVEGKKLVNRMYFNDNVTVHKKDDYSYVILADDTIAITKYENELAKSLIIPARIDGKTVTALMGDGWNAVISSSELTSLELPSTLKVLGKRSIDAWNLKKLEIPAGVTEIGENAIYAYRVSSIELPEGVTKLGKNWMYSKAKSVNFPSTLTTLEENAFSYSDNITSIKLPETVTNVGKGAFAEMGRLGSLSLPENMVEIPERLAAASERLAKISIPAATETIGKQAFAGCTKLATVSFAKKDAQIKVIGDGAFAGSGLSKIALPESLTTIGKEAFQGCEKLSNVSMYDNITSIEPYAFSGCVKLTKISLSESLTTIKEGTFMGCKKLASVTIPESVTAIEDFAFEGCASKLTLTVTEGSFAHQWAEANGYKVKLAK